MMNALFGIPSGMRPGQKRGLFALINPRSRKAAGHGGPRILVIGAVSGPGAPEPEDGGGDRREGMAVDLLQIDGTARPGAWTEHVEPWRPAISAVWIVGDHSMSRLAASCSFQRSMTAFASARAAASATCRFALMAMSRPHVRTPMTQYCPNRAGLPPPLARPPHRWACSAGHRDFDR
jgi:hypothetical protein